MISSVRNRKGSGSGGGGGGGDLGGGGAEEEEEIAMIQRGVPSLSLADVDEQGVGKANATLSTAAEMRQEGESSSSAVEAKTTTTSRRKLGIVEMATYTLSAALASTSVLAIVASQSVTVYVAGALGAFNSANVFRQRLGIAGGESLREIMKAIRREITQLANINSSLIKELDDVQEEASRLEDIENILQEQMADSQREQNAFMDTLRESREIQKKIKGILRAQIAQEIIQQVLKADRDGDFRLDPEEIGPLLNRLRTLDGFTVKEDRFREYLVSRNFGLKCVIDLIQNLMTNEEKGEAEDAIFHFDVSTKKWNKTAL